MLKLSKSLCDPTRDIKDFGSTTVTGYSELYSELEFEYTDKTHEFVMYYQGKTIKFQCVNKDKQVYALIAYDYDERETKND